MCQDSENLTKLFAICGLGCAIAWCIFLMPPFGRLCSQKWGPYDSMDKQFPQEKLMRHKVAAAAHITALFLSVAAIILFPVCLCCCRTSAPLQITTLVLCAIGSALTLGAMIVMRDYVDTYLKCPDRDVYNICMIVSLALGCTCFVCACLMVGFTTGCGCGGSDKGRDGRGEFTRHDSYY